MALVPKDLNSSRNQLRRPRAAPVHRFGESALAGSRRTSPHSASEVLVSRGAWWLHWGTDLSRIYSVSRHLGRASSQARGGCCELQVVIESRPPAVALRPLPGRGHSASIHQPYVREQLVDDRTSESFRFAMSDTHLSRLSWTGSVRDFTRNVFLTFFRLKNMFSN